MGKQSVEKLIQEEAQCLVEELWKSQGEPGEWEGKKDSETERCRVHSNRKRGGLCGRGKRKVEIKTEPERSSDRGMGTQTGAWRWAEMGRRGTQGARRDAGCNVENNSKT